MTRTEQQRYAEAPVIATYCMCNWGGIEILDILYGIEDYVVYRFNFGEPKEVHKAKIKYGARHDSFKTYAGYSIRLDECMRVR